MFKKKEESSNGNASLKTDKSTDKKSNCMTFYMRLRKVIISNNEYLYTLEYLQKKKICRQKKR